MPAVLRRNGLHERNSCVSNVSEKTEHNIVGCVKALSVWKLFTIEASACSVSVHT